MELLIAAGVLGLVALGASAIRIVPAGHRGVVTRGGQPVRQRAPGLLPVLPLAERVVLVRLNPAPLEPVAVTATTRDGAEVRLVLSVLWRVTDPMRPIDAGVDARLAIADDVERSARHLIAAVGLEELLRRRGVLLADLARTSTGHLEELGLQVIDADLLDLDVRFNHLLLELLASRVDSG